MRAVVYRENGPSSVLRLVERPMPEPEPGEVRVRVHVSGVNPTDWKARAGTPLSSPEQVPNQDGAGVIDSVGPGVEPDRVGERVWLWEAARQRTGGTAAEYLVVPSVHAVTLPDSAPFELGASLGVPFLTAHRALTINEGGPRQLTPGTLDGRTVLVAGGAGAVGNASIQLARWAGATVIATVSSPEKAALATSAGAQYVINYRVQDVAAEVRRIASGGVDTVVEVAAAANAPLDVAVLARQGAVAIYAGTPGDIVATPVRELMTLNARWQYILVYTMTNATKADGVAAISAAVRAGAVRVGEDAGLPLSHFPLDQTAAAHDAVEHGAVGKVLIDVG
ncbi:MAG TPA: NADPH:quinone reductase [Jatrophihabitantaceae bacterium]|jgi:NADPH2:quinone reductase